MSHGHHKPIAVLYHGGCPDGFGAAYAAWKKFGDEADYIPVKYDAPVPTNLEGKDIYMVDFCYSAEVMENLRASARSITVLDHHEGVRAVVESMPHHVYDPERSGSTITWRHFHPDTPLPLFLQYVEDADLYKKVPDDERAILTFCYAHPFHFDTWDDYVMKVEDPEERQKIIERGKAYQEYFDLLVHQLAGAAELVEFEGYTCYLSPGERMFITPLAHVLSEMHPPLALIVRTGATNMRVSMRGNGSVDVSAIARKYGGNGHPNSAAFSIPLGTPPPWKPVIHS